MTRFVVTDSTAYLEEGFISKHNIRVVPLNVHLNDLVFKEGQEMSNGEYYRILRTQPVFPKTSQPSAGEFLQVFEQMALEDEALVFLLSGELSGTVHSALMARDMDEAKASNIHILDSMLTSAPLMMVVLHAVEGIDQDLPTARIIEEAESICQKMSTYFVVDNLEYLVRGGRIGHWSRVLANTLKIKPVLQLKNGKIELYQKIRTKHKALDHIRELIAAEASSITRLAVVHVDSPLEAERWRDQIAQVYSGDILVSEIGPVIGSHVGPGTLGAAWY